MELDSKFAKNLNQKDGLLLVYLRGTSTLACAILYQFPFSSLKMSATRLGTTHPGIGFHVNTGAILYNKKVIRSLG